MKITSINDDYQMHLLVRFHYDFFIEKKKKVDQIYKKDPQSAESKEKSNFRFLFFSSYGHFCDVIIPIFD